jgi:uncharacterized protein
VEAATPLPGLFHALQRGGIERVVRAIMEAGGERLKAWPVFAISAIQLFLFLAHWFLYRTWIYFSPGLGAGTKLCLLVATLVLAFSFVPAALLNYRASNHGVRVLYVAASVWLGFLNYFFWAACLCWPAWLVLRLCGLADGAADPPHAIAAALFGAAAAAGIFGVINARIIRVRHLSISLPNLPAAWRGRRALVMSDLHLGSILGARFAQRLAALARRLNPEIVFLPGDLFDGTHIGLDRMLAPLTRISAPLGIYFSAGNHEEFGDPAPFLKAAAQAGIKILENERVNVEGVDIIGLSFGDSTNAVRVRAFLEELGLDAARSSILLNHSPERLPIVEQAGVSLQLSGHTHGGQIFPFTLITRRFFGRFTQGLNRLGSLQVLTSTGAGTWGPPMRVGSSSEVVLLTFN